MIDADPVLVGGIDLPARIELHQRSWFSSSTGIPLTVN
jgi:hypothetical protein